MTMKAAYLHFSDCVCLLINEYMCLEKTIFYPWKYIPIFIHIRLLAILSKVSWQTLHLLHTH